MYIKILRSSLEVSIKLCWDGMAVVVADLRKSSRGVVVGLGRSYILIIFTLKSLWKTFVQIAYLILYTRVIKSSLSISITALGMLLWYAYLLVVQLSN
jgi:hypothetical protein